MAGSPTFALHISLTVSPKSVYLNLAELLLDQAYAYLKKRRHWMRYRHYRSQHLPIGSGITEAACKTVFTQRLKRSGMSWTISGGQVIVDLRVIWLSGIWDKAHQAYLASKPIPMIQREMEHSTQHGRTL